MKYTVGIIGNGRFGSMLYKAFERFGKRDNFEFEVMVFDRNNPSNNTRIDQLSDMKNDFIKKFVSLEEVCKCDIIIPAVPISVFEEVIEQIKELVEDTRLVIDVCSVSIHPAKVMMKNLNCDLLSTHPMFGPDSSKDATNFNNLKFIFHKLRISDHEKADTFLRFWKSLGCDMKNLEPEEHDKQAAYTHAFAFMIGKIGIFLDVRRNDISTKGFEGILYNQEVMERDTSQLFHDMMTYNPYAKEMREKMMSSLIKIEEDLL